MLAQGVAKWAAQRASALALQSMEVQSLRSRMVALLTKQTPSEGVSIIEKFVFDGALSKV